MVLGDNEQTSREAWADNHLGDRSSLDLIGQQEDLARAVLALGKPTIVVLLNGRPLSVNYLAGKRRPCSRAGTSARRPATASPTCCSAGSIRAASCR
jgi:hypothetical protein